MGVHHEVVNMFLCSGQLQLPGNHRHHQDRAACSLWEPHFFFITVGFWTNLTLLQRKLSTHLSHHYPSEEADAAATVSVRHHVSITDGQEGDGDHPQGLHVVATQVPVVVVSVAIKKRLIFSLWHRVSNIELVVSVDIPGDFGSLIYFHEAHI